MTIRDFPFLTTATVFAIARIATALFFLAHALTRILVGSIAQFGIFMESAGFPNGVAVVWAITVTEIIAGGMLVANRLVRPAAVALAAIVLGGIALIHAGNGWFVGEHGTGGMEYSAALLVLLMLVAARDRDQRRGD